MTTVAQRIYLALLAEEEGTFSLATGEPATQGYAYCPDTAPLVEVDAVSQEAVNRAVELAEGCTHLGTWRHPRGSLVFLRTIVTASVEEAERACRKTGQLALYDLGAGREIPVGS